MALRDTLPGIEQRFTSVEVCRLAGVTFRRLDYWAGLGLFPGMVQTGRGPGSTRTFSRRDVELARAIRQLTDAGVSMAAISKALRRGGFHDMLLKVADAVAAVSWTAEAERIA